MSLFSIVQGRVPPPMPAAPPLAAPAPAAPVPPMPQSAPAPMPQMNMPAPAPMAAPPVAAPPMAAPPVPGSAMGGTVTGYMHGGIPHIGFEADYAPAYIDGTPEYKAYDAQEDAAQQAATNRYMTDGVMGIPGYETGGHYMDIPSGGNGNSNPQNNGIPGYVPTGDPLVDGEIVNQMANNGLTYDAAKAIAQGQRYLFDANQKNSGGSNAPDHFYAQQAEAARQFNATLAQKQQEDADQRTLGNYNAAAARAQSEADWRAKQQQGLQAKQNNVTQAASQAQNAFLEALKQADPNQGHPVYFTPTAIYEDAKQNNTMQPMQNYAPNLPGKVY